jgi:CheY-like chemotaxis protein
MSGPDGNARIKLDKINVLVVDENQQSLDILAQVLSGFGVRSIHKAESVKDALRAIDTEVFDFILSDANMSGMDGFEFIKTVRRMPNQPNALIPILLVAGHARASHVHKARDCGANFVVAKPITPKVLLERIFWVAKENRMFIQTPTYLGPERRFKREGPPIGMSGRRKDDLHAALGEATTPNLSQDQINGMMKPMKVVL